MRGREALAAFVVNPQSNSPFDLTALLLHSASPETESAADDVDDARERSRDRLLLLLNLLSCLLRDLALLSSDGEQPGLINADLEETLRPAASRYEPDLLVDALEVLDRAATDLRRNMDPSLALEEALLQVRTLLWPVAISHRS